LVPVAKTGLNVPVLTARFESEATAALALVTEMIYVLVVTPSSTFLIVEYDTTRFNPWVPYPINYANLHQLFTTLGYTSITKLSEAPSRFGGRMYSALIRL
jgi:hypothetical protein